MTSEADKNYGSSMKQAAKAAAEIERKDVETLESGKAKGRLRSLLQSEVSSKDAAEPTCKIFHSILPVTHMQADKVWKAVSVYEFIYFSSGSHLFSFFFLNFLQKSMIWGLLPKRGEVLLWRGLMCLQSRKGSIQTIKMIVTKLCKYLEDERSSN